MGQLKPLGAGKTVGASGIEHDGSGAVGGHGLAGPHNGVCFGAIGGVDRRRVIEGTFVDYNGEVKSSTGFEPR